jgi:hypothetical protein
MFDRYFLVLLPGAFRLAVADSGRSRLRWAPGVVTVTLMAAVSLAAHHDWLAGNIARWELGNRALAAGVAVTDLEGGLEWNGWHFGHGKPVGAPAAPDAAAPGLPPHCLTLWFSRQHWPQITGRYALSFSEIEGTITVDREPYRRWLPPGRHEFFLIKCLHAPDHPSGTRARP